MYSLQTQSSEEFSEQLVIATVSFWRHNQRLIRVFATSRCPGTAQRVVRIFGSELTMASNWSASRAGSPPTSRCWTRSTQENYTVRGQGRGCPRPPGVGVFRRLLDLMAKGRSVGQDCLVAKRQAPPEKKVQSYQKDRRNTYGEAGARSRFSIRRRKAWVNRSYRRSVREEMALAARSHDPGEDPSDQVRRKGWTKTPDEPLGTVVERKHTRRFRSGGRVDPPESSELQGEAKRRNSRSRDRPKDADAW